MSVDLGPARRARRPHTQRRPYGRVLKIGDKATDVPIAAKAFALQNTLN